jgi:ABC-2 type transport system permease protein
MKGLILKDLYVVRKYALMVFGIIAIFSFASTFSVFTAVFCVALAMNAFAYDNICKWDQYATSLPISRKTLVLSKYITTFLFMIGCIFVQAIMLFLSSLIHHTAFSVDSLLPLALLSGMTLISNSIFLPLIFKFGTEKARIVFIIAIVVLGGIAGAFTGFYSTGNSAELFNTSMSIVLPILSIIPFVALGLYVISYFVSVALYSTRDL